MECEYNYGCLCEDCALSRKLGAEHQMNYFDLCPKDYQRHLLEIDILTPRRKPDRLAGRGRRISAKLGITQVGG